MIKKNKYTQLCLTVWLLFYTEFYSLGKNADVGNNTDISVGSVMPVLERNRLHRHRAKRYSEEMQKINENSLCSV